MWANSLKFLGLVEEVWKNQVAGIKMYQVVKKLKTLKKELKQLNKTGYATKQTLTEIQEKLHEDFMNTELQEKENEILQSFKQTRTEYFSFLQKKAKIKWLQVGHENTTFFHRSLRIQKHKKRIIVVKNKEGD